MRKVMMSLVMMMVLTLLVNAEPLKVVFKNGDQALKVYYSHPECQTLSPANFLAKFAELNNIPNTDEAFRKLQADTTYLVPVLEEVLKVETTAVTLGLDFNPGDVGMFVELEAMPWAEIVPPVTEVADLKSKLVDKENQVASLESEVRELERKLTIQEKKIYTDGKYLQSLSQPIIPIIPISTAYAIGSVVIIILFIIFIGFLLYKVSQLKSDRLRLECNLQNIRRQMEEEFAERMKPIIAESNKRRRNAIYMRHLLEHDYYFFHFPGTVVKATRQPVEDIILPIEDRRPNGLALVRIVGIEELVPARPQMIEAALRSASHRRSDKAFILPPLTEQPQQPEKEPVIEKPQITHRSPVGITAAAS